MTRAKRLLGRLRGRSAALVSALLLAVSCAPGRPSEARMDGRAPQDSETAQTWEERDVARPPTFRGLVVLLVIDQLPQYLIDRYDTLFVGGIRRLLDEGRVYTRALHGHARTSTAPGYTTLATGVHPYRHGIVDNSWREPEGEGWVVVNNFFDAGEEVVGLPGGRGFSPRVLERTTFADWLREADPDARVLAVSGKVRGTVPLAGHGEGHVYVLSDEHGPAFVTSTFYRDALPDWVRRFNEGPLRTLLADSVWESTVPAAAAAASRSDTAAYERRGSHGTFPHVFAGEEEVWAEQTDPFLHWFWRSPMLDEASIAFGIEGVRALDLGRRDGVDLLALGLSATDPIGHTFGPHSREQLDNLLRLDRALGGLFEFLDDAVGRDRYMVALTADHGVLPVPEYRRERGEAGARVPLSEVYAALRAVDEVVAADEAELHARRAAALERFDFVADAMTGEELIATDPSTPLAAAADSFLVLYRRSYRPDRAMSTAERGILVRLREGYMVDDAVATHGSPYGYDRHVPLVYMGPGIGSGRLDEAVATVDVAPTLASLIGVRVPADLDGRVLVEGLVE